MNIVDCKKNDIKTLFYTSERKHLLKQSKQIVTKVHSDYLIKNVKNLEEIYRSVQIYDLLSLNNFGVYGASTNQNHTP